MCSSEQQVDHVINMINFHNKVVTCGYCLKKAAEQIASFEISSKTNMLDGIRGSSNAPYLRGRKNLYACKSSFDQAYRDSRAHFNKWLTNFLPMEVFKSYF